jgi:hypothetical protein
MTSIELRTDGPHSDDYTIEVARAFGEVMRVLNYATRSGAGLAYPQTVYTVTGSLATGGLGFRQLFDQIIGFLGQQAAGGRLADDSGADPARVVQRAVHHLRAAQDAANALVVELSAAQSATSGLHVPDTGGAEGGERP